MAGLEGNAQKNNEWWPWHQYAPWDVDLKHPSRENLILLSDDQVRKGHVEKIVSRVKVVWE